MATYIIRKSAYAYSDEYYYEQALGVITETFTDKDEAYARLTKLEVPNFRRYDMGEIEQLSICGYLHKYQKERHALDDYLMDTLGFTILTRVEDTDDLYVDMNTHLPDALSDEEIMKIRELTGIRFHELSVFENEIKFYAIWLPLLNKFHHVEHGNAEDAIYFFNSYDEALQYASKMNLTRILRDHKPLHGTLEALSDQPAMLKSFIEATEHISYDEDTKEIKTNYQFWLAGGFGGLNALLKNPLFEIRDFPYEQAKHVPYAPFEFI